MKDVKEDGATAGTSVTNNSVDTSPGVKQIVMTDRRYDPKKPPVLLKKFRKYIEK